MKKFSAENDILEVCAIGSAVPYYLHRNIILLLGVHGVRDETFIEIQRNMLNELDKMMRCPETAATLLPRLSGFDSATRSTILNVLRCGATPRTDPYLYSCLVAIRGHHLVNLQVKAR